ncbi:MAG: hypothetical protein ACOVQE_03050 [Chitinophagaceae bacterium]
MLKHISLLFFAFLIYTATHAQCKTYRLNDNGDTLNCTDVKGLKQGKWVIKMPALRGEPGYEAEGIFVNDLKEGLWRNYNLVGDLIAEEQYKWGYKNGICRYFSVAGLEREESWKAVNPENPYDTIDVPDPAAPSRFERVVIKLDGKTLKDGIWKYYYSGSMSVMRTETYRLDKLVVPEINEDLKNEEAAKKKIAKPKEILEYEKKNQGKKQIKVRTGGAGL